MQWASLPKMKSADSRSLNKNCKLFLLVFLICNERNYAKLHKLSWLLVDWLFAVGVGKCGIGVYGNVRCSIRDTVAMDTAWQYVVSLTKEWRSSKSLSKCDKTTDSCSSGRRITSGCTFLQRSPQWTNCGCDLAQILAQSFLFILSLR